MADNTLVYYTNPMSRGRTPHWMLEEIGEPYETKVLSFDKKEHKAPAYLAINPMGKIPTLVHRGVVITESAAICAYLADAFPAKKLAPALNDPMRGVYLRWFFFAASCVEPAIIDKMLNRPMPEREGSLGYGKLSDVLNTLETALKPGPFLCGDHFTAADVYLCSQLGFAAMVKAIDLSPSFQTYMARCAERPAYKRVNEIFVKLTEQMKK